MQRQQKIEINEVFPTPIFETYIQEDFSDLADYWIRQSKLQKGEEKSNYGGWQSPDVLNHPEMKNLLEEINTSCEGLFKSFLKDITLHIADLWVNINKSGDYNKRHIHSYSVLSGVLFLKTPEGCSDLLFERDDSSIHYMAGRTCNFMWGHARVKAEKNKIVLFPSWMPHEVEASKFDGERISIAFNTTAIFNCGHE
jgi:uncharacterized protein (TIGR02466 family)